MTADGSPNSAYRACISITYNLHGFVYDTNFSMYHLPCEVPPPPRFCFVWFVLFLIICVLVPNDAVGRYLVVRVVQKSTHLCILSQATITLFSSNIMSCKLICVTRSFSNQLEMLTSRVESAMRRLSEQRTVFNARNVEVERLNEAQINMERMDVGGVMHHATVEVCIV